MEFISVSFGKVDRFSRRIVCLEAERERGVVVIAHRDENLAHEGFRERAACRNATSH